MIVLEGNVLSVMRAHAAAAYPGECCGALVGRVDETARTVVDVSPIENTAPAVARRYVISASAYRRVERSASDRGAVLLGFYHSHPDALAEPSASDLSEAWPNMDYIIIAVEQARPARITAWRLRDDRSGFEPEDITWPTGS